MNYAEIYKPLSRTSFASKMMHAFYASIKTMSINGQVESDVLQTLLLPDEIETFVLNSVVVQEYDNKEMTCKQFIEVMNAIRNYQPPECYEKMESEHLKWVLPTIGAVQFESQQYSFFRLYRHHFLFSFKNEKIDVEKSFKEMFTRTFDEYAAIVFTFQVLLAQKKLVEFIDYWKKVDLKAPWFISALKMTREQYKEELSQFANSAADYKYCLRPSYSYPFIEYQGTIFLPTPHLLIQSITTAMMNRLTFDNNDLREKIGKNTCESYVYTMFLNSGLFDEVKPEYEYSKGKRTLDVLARKGNTALLIDSKLFSPKVSLRTYDEEAYRKDTERIVKVIKQAYVHAHDKINQEYYPFSTDIHEVYALVVVYQEGYIDLAKVYKQVAQILSIKRESVEYTWLCNHVGFTDIATIERFMLSKTDIIPEIMNRDASLNKWLTGRNNSDLTAEVHHYREKLVKDASKTLRDLYGIAQSQIDSIMDW